MGIIYYIPKLWNLNIPISISPLKEPFKGNLGFPIMSDLEAKNWVRDARSRMLPQNRVAAKELNFNRKP